MPGHGLRRHRRYWLLVCLALATFAAPPATAAGERPRLDWLQYDPELLKSYEVSAEAGDSARQAVTPTWTAGAAAASKPYRILLLIPIKSVDAYSISVNTILGVFRDHEIPAVFELWFYDKQPAIAGESIAWAEGASIDLIMTVGSLATEYVHSNYRGGRIPVVTSASKDPVLMGQMPDYVSGSGTNIAYTSINVSIDAELAYLGQLIPKLRNIAVIYAQDNKSAVETQVRPLKAAAPQAGIAISEVVVRDESHAVEDIDARLPPVVDLLRQGDPELKHSILLVTGSTSVYDQIQRINSHTGPLPVIATLPDVVRAGEDTAVLSIGVNQSTAVQIAALYAIAILTGEAKVGNLKVGVASPPDIAISFLRARRIGLKIPFGFFESATFIYDYDGRPVRAFGQRLTQ
jgi:putative tryptophan/tyrosine transport system substrate-binding protein